MPLLPCPACGNKVSVAAESCPQCGHPFRAAAKEPAGPECYACSRTATTRCQSCGEFSCATHLQSIYIPGEGGGHELRCASCYSSASAWQTFGCIFILVLVAIVGAVLVVGNLPRH